MPRIHNGLASWLVLQEKVAVITHLRAEVTDHAVAVAGSLRIKFIQQPAGRDHDLRHQFLAEIPLILFLFPARIHILRNLVAVEFLNPQIEWVIFTASQNYIGS